MTLAGLLVRFAAAYLVLVLVVSTGMNMLGVRGGPVINMAVLLASVLGCCLAFARRNGRGLAGAEKTRAVLGMLAIDVAFQLLLLGLVSPPLPQGPEGTPWLGLGGLFAVIMLLHAVAIYWCVGWAQRLRSRQLQREEARRLPS